MALRPGLSGSKHFDGAFGAIETDRHFGRRAAADTVADPLAELTQV
jgi:hypothetical protein